MSNHLAITIGPIYSTMSLAKKTRELWSVSFTFSLLMEKLIHAFKKHGTLISPGTGVTFPMHGAGIYPDRCYFELSNELLTEQQISVAKQEAFANFHQQVNLTGTENYYQVYIVQAAIAANPIGTLNKMLDVLELQQNYSPKPVINWKEKWKKGDYFQNLYDKGFASDDDLLPDLYLNNQEAIRRFPSIPEISTNEFAKKFGERYWQAIGYQGLINKNQRGAFTRITDLSAEYDDDDTIIKKVKKAFSDDFLQRHKYFSIVQADGDNVGKLIEAIETDGGNLTELSGCLNKFAATATELLVRYGAFPVYAGGDDLLFFAPIASNSVTELQIVMDNKAHGNVFGNNLFFLLTELNQKFQKSLAPVIKNDIKISLSFGVMCGYYKQPLREIKEAANEALFLDAKSQPGKNFISMKVQKHSGQSFSLGFKQEGRLFENFLTLSYKASLNIEDNFLNSVMYKLDDQKAILELIGEDRIKLKIFFEENFNESYKKFKDFFEAAAELIAGVFTDFKGKPLETKIDKIYGALRFVHFINAKDVND